MAAPQMWKNFEDRLQNDDFVDPCHLRLLQHISQIRGDDTVRKLLYLLAKYDESAARSVFTLLLSAECNSRRGLYRICLHPRD